MKNKILLVLMLVLLTNLSVVFANEEVINCGAELERVINPKIDKIQTDVMTAKNSFIVQAKQQLTDTMGEVISGFKTLALLFFVATAMLILFITLLVSFIRFRKEKLIFEALETKLNDLGSKIDKINENKNTIIDNSVKTIIKKPKKEKIAEEPKQNKKFYTEEEMKAELKKYKGDEFARQQ